MPHASRRSKPRRNCKPRWRRHGKPKSCKQSKWPRGSNRRRTSGEIRFTRVKASPHKIPHKRQKLRICHFEQVTYFQQCAPVAQMDRAVASGATGRRFESCQAYQQLHWFQYRLSSHIHPKGRFCNKTVPKRLNLASLYQNSFRVRSLDDPACRALLSSCSASHGCTS